MSMRIIPEALQNQHAEAVEWQNKYNKDSYMLLDMSRFEFNLRDELNHQNRAYID